MSWFKSKPAVEPKKTVSTFDKLDVGMYFAFSMEHYKVLEKFPATQAIRAQRIEIGKTGNYKPILIKVTDSKDQSWYNKINPKSNCPSELTGPCIYWEGHYASHSDGKNTWVEA